MKTNIKPQEFVDRMEAGQQWAQIPFKRTVTIMEIEKPTKCWRLIMPDYENEYATAKHALDAVKKDDKNITNTVKRTAMSIIVWHVITEEGEIAVKKLQ